MIFCLSEMSNVLNINRNNSLNDSIRIIVVNELINNNVEFD